MLEDSFQVPGWDSDRGGETHQLSARISGRAPVGFIGMVSETTRDYVTI